MVFDLNDLILCYNCILFRQTIRRHLAEKVARRNRSAYRLTVLTTWLTSKYEVKCILTSLRVNAYFLYYAYPVNATVYDVYFSEFLNQLQPEFAFFNSL